MALFPLLVIFPFPLILLLFLTLSFVVLHKSDIKIKIANVSFHFILIRKSCGTSSPEAKRKQLNLEFIFGIISSQLICSFVS